MLLRRIPDRNVWIIYAAILLLGVAYGVSIAVLAIHLKEHGIPELAMGGLAAAFALGIVAFSIPSGWVVQRFGAKKTLLVALLGYATCVSIFPFLTTTSALSIARFFDGSFSVAVWVAAETALLARSDKTNKAFVMSLYAMSLGLGYVFGPILAMGVVKAAGTTGTFVAAGVLAFVAAAVFALAGPAIIDLMTANEEVREMARRYLPWAVATPIAGVLAFQMDGVFIGATWSRDMRNMMLASLVLFLAVWWWAEPALGTDGLWLALLVFLSARGLTLAWRCRGRIAATFGPRDEAD